MLKYHLGWQDAQGRSYGKNPGKFIRPTLCLLSCQAAGGNISQILPAAASLELIHNFSLIHDDIEDNSPERHHRATVWKLWGQPHAINAGDAMSIIANLTLLKLRDSGVSDAKVMRSMQIFSEACLEICEGQSLDITYEKRSDITIADYFRMATKKTAALLAASSSIGAYLATEDDEIVTSFYRFGENLGIAYQIHDDILGTWGMEEKTGKSVHSDIAQKKKTLPAAYGFAYSRDKDREALERFYSQESVSDKNITEVVEILNRLDTKNYTQKLERQYHHRALAELEATGIEPSRQAPLKELACFLLGRDF